jgi:tetratricopeptide (TPR) repeat protein
MEDIMAAPDKLSVFLCHSSADKPAVKELYKRLSSQGWIDPWLDSEKLLPGQDWNTEIERALETAHAVIVTLSKGSVNKEGYLQREFKYALDVAFEKPEGSIFIIPLKLEEIDKLELPRSLRSLQYVDYFPKNKRVSAFERILESLRIRAVKLGITQNIEAPSSETRTRIDKKKKPSNVDTSRQKNITSNAEFPIIGIPFSQNRNFSGRQNVLDLIRDKFTNKKSSIPIYAITGLGGIGKTQIAVHYSYEYANEYDLIWWIRSETDASISADYQALSDALLLPVKTKAEQMVFVNLVNNFLENTQRKWLLVFDNVESKERVEKFLPIKGNGHILITSQSRDWREIASDLHLIPFTKEEAWEFLSRRIGEKDHEKSDKLTDLLGGLPLAIEQACAYMSKHGTPVEIYLKLFAEQQQELWKRESSPKDYHATLITTWGMAFKQIRQVQPVAEKLLSIFAFFAPDGISLSVFKLRADLLPEDMQKVVNNPVELEECLAALYSYSLIEREGDFISIHRLVQDVIRISLSPNNFQKWLGLALQIIDKAFPYDEYDIDTWSICAQTLPHALTASDYAEKHSVGLETASNLYQKMGDYLSDKAENERASELIEHAIKIRRELSMIKDNKLAESLDTLGEIREAQSKLDEAFQLYEQANKILKENSSLQTQEAARNFANLGGVLRRLGEYETAKKHFEKAFEISQLVVGMHHPDTAAILEGLGNLFLEQGDLSGSEKNSQSALEIYHDFFREPHPSTAGSITLLGQVSLRRGEFEKARRYLEEALKILRVTIGERHPNIGTVLNDLGALFQEQGDFGTAKNYAEEALDIYRAAHGEDHPFTAATLSNLGMLFQEQGNFETAKSYLEESLSIYVRTLGENHPDCAMTLNNIGALLVKQSRYVEARHYLERAVSIYEKAHGSEHHRLVNMLFNLAYTLLRLKQFSQSRHYAARAVKICQEAKDKYAECEKIKQLQRSIPTGIGKQKH